MLTKTLFCSVCVCVLISKHIRLEHVFFTHRQREGKKNELTIVHNYLVDIFVSKHVGANYKSYIAAD